MGKTPDPLLGASKKHLRISAAITDYDEEIEQLIATAKADLIASGTDSAMVTLATAPLIQRAIITYVKANFGLNNPDAEKLHSSYMSQTVKIVLIPDNKETE
jgi:hypothetical protein